MVCENPYSFGDGINVNRKRDARLQTAQGPRGDPNARLDFMYP